MADYEYDATLVRVVDGDTVILDVDLGFNVRAKLDFRLVGLDTPETKGSTKQAGLASKTELERLLALGAITLRSSKSDKYGRWLATLVVTPTKGSPINVNTALLTGAFAKTYSGKGPKG